MSFNKATLRAIRVDIDKALESVGKKHGILLEGGNGSYSDDNFKMQLKASRVNNDGTVITQQVSDFQLYAARYGLKPTDLGKTFASNGETFVLSGINPRATKMPILAHRVGNANDKFKFAVSVIKNLSQQANSNAMPASINYDALPANIQALIQNKS